MVYNEQISHLTLLSLSGLPLESTSPLLRWNSIVRQREDERGVALHVDEEVVDVDEQEVDALLAEGGVDQHLAQLGEQAQQVDGSVGAYGQQARVLRPILRETGGRHVVSFLSSTVGGLT